jgi:hypothetical protein
MGKIVFFSNNKVASKFRAYWQIFHVFLLKKENNWKDAHMYLESRLTVYNEHFLMNVLDLQQNFFDQTV